MSDIVFAQGELKKIYGENHSKIATVAQVGFHGQLYVYVFDKKQYTNLKFHFSPYRHIKVYYTGKPVP